MAGREDNSAPADGRRHRWVGYVWTIALESLMTLGLVALLPVFPLGRYPIAYVLLIMLIAYLFGEGPAILAFVLGALAFDYFFVSPFRSVWPIANTPFDWAGYAAFLIGTSIVGFATVLMRRSRQQIERLLAEQRRELAERKKAEEALRESEERLRLAIEAASLGTWDLDLTTDVAVRSLRHDQIWGYTEPQPEWGLEIAMRNVVPEDRPRIMEAYERGIKTGVLSHENRIVWPDGTIHWISAYGRFRYDSEGRPLRVIGIVADITERKLAEEREHQREREQLEFYRRTIMAATGGKLVITDRPKIERIAGPAVGSWLIRTHDDIRVIREAIEHAASDVGFDQSRCERLGIAAGEAITNVLKHAGEGEVSAHRIEDGLIVVVTDRGPGIPALALPDVALTRGYSTAGTLGVGYKVMIEFTNRVYLATSDEGTTVALEMKRHAPEISPAFGLKPVESKEGAAS